MNPTITIVETCPYHLREMAEAMSADSVDVAYGIGLTPLRALWSSYRKSIYCKTAFIDGKIAAIWGLNGVVFSDTAMPWLIMTPETMEYPMRVAFRYRKELEIMLKMFPCLEEYVPVDNVDSIRLLELMGFKVSKNKVQCGSVMLHRAEQRA